ncbi:unnamed protein product [Schistosoma margrebowiei]|uniref:Uncharacterized protein n=1 Tax=Schistosoma margrebowiei TaxID=48269 RepID=A0A183MF81_9TREM|nr:unnamed protein product [Schistosoma margrebowiei]
MVVGGSQQETLDSGFVLLVTRQQGVPVILKELVLPDGFDPVSSSFTVRDVTTELSGLRPYVIIWNDTCVEWQKPMEYSVMFQIYEHIIHKFVSLKVGRDFDLLL